MLAVLQTEKFEDYPLFGYLQLIIQYIHSYPPYLETCFSICNMKTNLAGVITDLLNDETISRLLWHCGLMHSEVLVSSETFKEINMGGKTRPSKQNTAAAVRDCREKLVLHSGHGWMLKFCREVNKTVEEINKRGRKKEEKFEKE